MDKDREQLEKFASDCIQRTFVNALANLELLDLDKRQFQTIRKNILGQGNSEIRLLKQELKNYEVERTGQYNDFVIYDNYLDDEDNE